jgi:hypothetical protein
LTGRPSTFTQEIAREICSRLAQGQSLRTVCADEDMPAKSTVFRWMQDHDGFRDQYVRAKGEGSDAIAEQMFDIADEEPPLREDGSVDPGFIAYAKHRTETRKWYLARIAPKRFGDKIEQTLVGADGGPIKTETVLAVDEKVLGSILDRL